MASFLGKNLKKVIGTFAYTGEFILQKSPAFN